MRSGEPPRVLVVDDHPALRDAVCATLRRCGCVVQTAANGVEALERLARDHFDAIVSDVEMPVMDGITLRERVLARHPHLHRRFLLCSGMPLPKSLAHDASVAFLPKPMVAADLWAAVRELLAHPPEPPASSG